MARAFGLANPTMKSPSVLLPLLALAACGSGMSTTIQPNHYDTSCQADVDCSAVFVGDPCTTACQCTNAAINVADLPRARSELAAAEGRCTGSRPVCNMACTVPVAACIQGVCRRP
jgi:hypothetical protein